MATPLCYTIIIPFFTALLLVGWIHPRLVKIALLKNIVDNPDARKLQRTPVPVLGGVAVFFGVVIAIGCMSSVVDCSGLPVVIMAMMAMLYTGTMDDILSLSPGLRFVIEIVVVLLLIFVGGYCIDDFHGLWNIGRFSYWCAVPLTVVAAVGIINAINLVDGVNGLSSGYCIMACLIFGTLFFLAGEAPMTILAAVSVGALIPFFLHNVFGKTSKMFIGDGGTLVLGVVMSVFVIAILQNGSRVAAYVNPNVGLVPFTLAVLSVPVFDTLRVMSTRILKGTSPFRPDKTHLHHMFIDLGCSHVATTLAILGVNMFVVLCWWALEASGFSIAVQLYAVIAVSLLVTSGLYHFMQWHICRDTRFMRAMRRLGYKTHISRTGIFFWLQQVMDKV
ncbi:glycosyltransferase family 4 protein [Alistipes finegoldii]|uniref:glycosyltransferase family 4 protein n=1 Tax=Alistipes finegoldii TaxID=214856 RepID=UPI001EDFC8D6|nr:MraY family glycosyltransferase [Alistipes finegoldii]MCG4955652.1 undecaprenyl/decaprenyl-phosphate alpha-N-acetylglucosaminyl 1-phosphate transferase [Alistipes finegoldii]